MPPFFHWPANRLKSREKRRRVGEKGDGRGVGWLFFVILQLKNYKR